MKRFVKSDEAVAAIREGGKLLGEILEKIGAAVRVGATALQMDELAQHLIRDCGGRPSFLGYSIGPRYPAYPAALCVSVNDEVVHGIPKASTVFADGDIVGLDIGMEWPFKKGTTGFYTDTAMSVGVGQVSERDQKLMDRTRAALFAGIAAARGGADIRDVSRAIEGSLTPFGYGIVEDLVGHGVGYGVHEDPQVPNYVYRGAPSIPLVPQMVLALEPMVNHGGRAVVTDRDHWTIKTADGSRSAHFEHTIIITTAGAEIVTLRPRET
ncbi:MAG: type I methionyl aminopeptidase [Candidatus Magasanikbacteria bacterium RIFCSPHIGHO2_02_FULL_50_9b]|uniref:Methionine aminopeptidase n=1 Tax=Candidatus Magasanikbacteria bacterium RIFCSPHIGHO2_02_FULL_50_9b TaxID=1798682 RepID=A0A1F6M6Z8_9BACT|nr:MAG: type I methionyl aminopeptidase [Candidatus Magasanikbacteria bacterium RIFCSPHIGHO2_02_FULL_50_9b]